MMLSNLAEIQTASKILLGAHYRAKEINPLDYCYSAMNVRLHDIAKYAHNTPRRWQRCAVTFTRSLSLSLSLLFSSLRFCLTKLTVSS
jgi:hypothetical protein